jgi:hypothetical protein
MGSIRMDSFGMFRVGRFPKLGHTRSELRKFLFSMPSHLTKIVNTMPSVMIFVINLVFDFMLFSLYIYKILTMGRTN